MRVTRVIVCVFLALMLRSTSAIIHHSKWLWLKNALLECLPTYEVTLMFNDVSKTSKLFREIIYEIQLNYATLIFDMSTLNSIFKEKIFSIACRGNFFIVFYQPGRQFFSQLSVYDGYWCKMCGSKPKPKILILLQHSNHTNRNSRRCFDVFWKNFYLDVTILDVLNSTEVMMYQYNPFTSIYSKDMLGPNTAFFPDKISNLFGKEISVAFFDHACSKARKDKRGKVKLVSGLCAKIVETLSDVMNFTTIIDLYESATTGIQYLPPNFTVGINDFCAYLVRQSNYFRRKNKFSFEQSMFLDTRTEYLIVPITRERLIGYPNKFVAFLGASTVIVFLCHLWARLIKFDLNYWYPYNIWNCLMGISGHMPVAQTERILFVTILVLSVTHSGDFLQECTTMHIAEIDALKMDTYEDLDKSGLIPGFKGTFFNQLPNKESQSIKNLISKSGTGNLVGCPDKFVMQGNVTCMVQPFIKDLMIDFFRRNDGLPLIKTLTDDSITMHWMVFPQRTNSPYVNQINKIIQLLLDHGLLAIWRENQQKDTIQKQNAKFLRFEKNKFIKLDDKSSGKHGTTLSLIYQLLFIFITGNFFAVFAFLIEMVAHRIPVQNAVIPLNKSVKSNKVEAL